MRPVGLKVSVIGAVGAEHFLLPQPCWPERGVTLMTTERSVFSSVPSDEVRCIRERIDHPVLDADGHQLEYLPLFLEVLGEVAGPSVVARYNRLRVDRGIGRVGPYWTLPSENTLDRASAMLPKLMYSRLDEIGIDYALMYPSLGLSVLAMVDDEVRQAAARALNIMFAEVYDGSATVWNRSPSSPTSPRKRRSPSCGTPSRRSA